MRTGCRIMRIYKFGIPHLVRALVDAWSKELYLPVTELILSWHTGAVVSWWPDEAITVLPVLQDLVCIARLWPAAMPCAQHRPATSPLRLRPAACATRERVPNVTPAARHCQWGRRHCRASWIICQRRTQTPHLVYPCWVGSLRHQVQSGGECSTVGTGVAAAHGAKTRLRHGAHRWVAQSHLGLCMLKTRRRHGAHGWVAQSGRPM